MLCAVLMVLSTMQVQQIPLVNQGIIHLLPAWGSVTPIPARMPPSPPHRRRRVGNPVP